MATLYAVLFKMSFLFFKQNIDIFVLFLHECLGCGIHKNRLTEAILMCIRNICFNIEIGKIFACYNLLCGAINCMLSIVFYYFHNNSDQTK